MFTLYSEKDNQQQTMLRALKVPGSVLENTLRKTLSLSATCQKQIVINNHYDFDQKVSAYHKHKQARDSMFVYNIEG